MPGHMILNIWNVQHGACAMVTHRSISGIEGKLAMIDSGHNHDTRWNPSSYIKHHLKRNVLDYLFVTNADQDHVSDLNNLLLEGIAITTFVRNRSVSAEVIRNIKQFSGALTDDLERYLDLHTRYVNPIVEPFDQNMGGITARAFWNGPPNFYDTNNLSMAVFINYGAFKILFPGDLEKDGWMALLDRVDFREQLAGTTVLVASHHGRESGYCDELFNYCHPQVIVISDKVIVHDTQHMTQSYRQRVMDSFPDGVFVQTTRKRRYVLTTRRDGWIQFVVDDAGNFDILTERNG